MLSRVALKVGDKGIGGEAFSTDGRVCGVLE